MARKKTHYQILGVNSDVSADEIKRAYRRLAKSQHPDAQGHKVDSGEWEAATEEMIQINEAYATLIDAGKRAEYDARLGIGLSSVSVKIKKPTFTSMDEDAQREKFLRSVFYPLRSSIGKLLNAYRRELKELSADPYDERLLENFQSYVDDIEDALRKGSDALTRTPTPPSLDAAVQMMRYSIAQAADGLEELRFFCLNFDYDHLTMAENLFRIAIDLSKQSLALTKGK